MSESKLRPFYEKMCEESFAPPIEYHGYRLEKAEAVGEIGSPEHSEVKVTRDGEVVESLTLRAMDDYERFQEIMDEIVESGAETAEEWLNR